MRGIFARLVHVRPTPDDEPDRYFTNDYRQCTDGCTADRND
jgi:hypothetical protein